MLTYPSEMEENDEAKVVMIGRKAGEINETPITPRTKSIDIEMKEALFMELEMNLSNSEMAVEGYIDTDDSYSKETVHTTDNTDTNAISSRVYTLVLNVIDELYVSMEKNNTIHVDELNNDVVNTVKDIIDTVDDWSMSNESITPGTIHDVQDMVNDSGSSTPINTIGTVHVAKTVHSESSTVHPTSHPPGPLSPSTSREVDKRH